MFRRPNLGTQKRTLSRTEPEVPGEAKEQVEVELAEVAEVVEIMCGESKARASEHEKSY